MCALVHIGIGQILCALSIYLPQNNACSHASISPGPVHGNAPKGGESQMNESKTAPEARKKDA